MEPYKTIQGTASAEYEEKKSRFIGQVAHVETEGEAVAFLDGVRAANPMARHNVYAYVLRADNRVRYSDDGEPARTSGLPTLSVIEHAGLKDVICVTTRYFGGTLLGTGGLVRAYTKAAQDAFAAAQVVTFAECIDLTVSVPYPLYDQLSHWLAEQGIQVLSTDFAGDVAVEVRVLATEADAVQAAIIELTHAAAEMLASEPSYQPLATNE
ncbi:MAG: YigZ family protein [Eggerthellaceae bacterium]|nr:YigZ family protein [Eggerthellaceae bacterium]